MGLIVFSGVTWLFWGVVDVGVVVAGVVDAGVVVAGVVDAGAGVDSGTVGAGVGVG